MRRSAERHPIAVLRRIIGLTQPEFAELVGISQSTIAKIESLKISLSFEHAMLIESETGCCALWLSEGDTKAPPQAGIIMPDQREKWEESEDEPFPSYELETFQWVRARKAAGLPVEELKHDGTEQVLAMYIKSILLACHKAKRRGNEKYARARLHTLANQFSRDVGLSEITDEGAPKFALELLDTVYFCVVSSTGIPDESSTLEVNEIKYADTLID